MISEFQNLKICAIVDRIGRRRRRADLTCSYHGIIISPQRIFIAMAGAFAIFGSTSTSVYAQSSVTLYGLISAGIGYTTNQGGSKTYQAISGTDQNPRWGLLGKEDLGGGMSAVFQLENGFSVINGTSAQSGREFGRQAFVGLADKRWGELTLGRQYDAIRDYVGDAVKSSNGINIGDSDNTFNDIRMQNSVKYVSPNFEGLDVRAQYGFSNSANFSNNSAYSLGIGYTNGAFRWGVAYVQYNNPFSATNTDGSIEDYTPALIFAKSATAGSVFAMKQSILGTAAYYTIGAAQLAALFTDVRYDYLDNSHLHLENVGANVVYSVTPSFFLDAAYVFTNGTYDVVERHSMWHQVNLQADYFFSKRTDVALTVIGQLATGDDTYAQIFSSNASSTKFQMTVSIGMRHLF